MNNKIKAIALMTASAIFNPTATMACNNGGCGTPTGGTTINLNNGATANPSNTAILNGGSTSATNTAALYGGNNTASNTATLTGGNQYMTGGTSVSAAELQNTIGIENGNTNVIGVQAEGGNGYGYGAGGAGGAGGQGGTGTGTATVGDIDNASTASVNGVAGGQAESISSTGPINVAPSNIINWNNKYPVNSAIAASMTSPIATSECVMSSFGVTGAAQTFGIGASAGYENGTVWNDDSEACVGGHQKLSVTHAFAQSNEPAKNAAALMMADPDGAIAGKLQSPEGTNLIGIFGGQKANYNTVIQTAPAYPAPVAPAIDR